VSPRRGGRPEDRPPLPGVRGGVAFRDAAPDLETALSEMRYCISIAGVTDVNVDALVWGCGQGTARTTV